MVDPLTAVDRHRRVGFTVVLKPDGVQVIGAKERATVYGCGLRGQGASSHQARPSSGSEAASAQTLSPPASEPRHCRRQPADVLSRPTGVRPQGRSAGSPGRGAPNGGPGAVDSAPHNGDARGGRSHWLGPQSRSWTRSSCPALPLAKGATVPVLASFLWATDEPQAAPGRMAWGRDWRTRCPS